jgi:hypothetical protein
VEHVRSCVQAAESHTDHLETRALAAESRAHGLEELLSTARARAERLRTTMANKASEMGCQATRAVGEYLLVNCVHHYPEVDPALVLEAAAPLEPEDKKKKLDDVAVYVHLLELVNVKS